jgi:cyanophycinase
MMRSTFIVALCVCSVLSLAGQQPGSTLTKGPLYDRYISGNPDDVSPTVRGGLLLAGGGTDQPDAFRWFFERAGGGDIVIIRASGSDGYHPFAMRIGGLDSIESFVVHSRDAATDPLLLRQITNAEGIFFAGGDQSRYVTYFKDSPVEDAINAAAKRGVPIGGTSAGLAILGEFSYAALKGSVTTAEATADPFNEDMTLDRGFLSLPHMGGLITDSHVMERGRLGRTVAFMARLLHDGWSREGRSRAIAIDRATAVLVSPDGSAVVVGDSTAHFMQTGPAPVIRPATPLTSDVVHVYTAAAGARFDLTTWTGSGGRDEQMRVTAGVTTPLTGRD